MERDNDVHPALKKQKMTKKKNTANNLGTYNFFVVPPGKRNFNQGVKCPGGQMSGDCLWRCTWPVSWPHGAVQDRREISRHKLFVYGRLRGQRVLLGGNCHFTSSTQGQLSVCKVYIRNFQNKHKLTYDLCLRFRCVSGSASLSWEETMRADRLHKCMASMTSA